jgi:hypothetical protein
LIDRKVQAMSTFSSFVLLYVYILIGETSCGVQRNPLGTEGLARRRRMPARPLRNANSSEAKLMVRPTCLHKAKLLQLLIYLATDLPTNYSTDRLTVL